MVSCRGEDVLKGTERRQCGPEAGLRCCEGVEATKRQDPVPFKM